MIADALIRKTQPKISRSGKITACVGSAADGVTPGHQADISPVRLFVGPLVVFILGMVAFLCPTSS